MFIPYIDLTLPQNEQNIYKKSKLISQRADWVWRAAVQADGSSQQTGNTQMSEHNIIWASVNEHTD